MSQPDPMDDGTCRGCGRYFACACPRSSSLLARLAAVERERDELRARIADYENRITWDTTCGNCARLLDASIKDYERAERAEARIATVDDMCENAQDNDRWFDDEGLEITPAAVRAALSPGTGMMEAS